MIIDLFLQQSPTVSNCPEHAHAEINVSAEQMSNSDSLVRPVGYLSVDY